MRTGVLLCSILAAVCHAGRPAASTQAVADTGSANLNQRIASLGGHASYRAALVNSRFDTTRARDALLERAGFPNPFLDRFLTSAGFTAASYGQWRSGLYLRGDLAYNGHYYGSPATRSEPWYSYESGVMQTIGQIGYFVVPAFLPPKAQDALEHQQDNSPPGGHGWPYHRW